MKDAEDEVLEQDAEDEGTDYRGLALQIGDDLHDDDIEAMKFISQDFISAAKLDKMKTVSDLFSSWEKSKKFGKNNPWFLAECLSKIQRLDLLEDLGIDEDVLEDRLKSGQSQISDYRKMLLEVAEDLDSEELHKMLYLLGDLKKKDKGKINSLTSLFSYLEQTKQISRTNLHKLKEMLKTIDRNDLIDTVSEYEVSKGLKTLPVRDQEERMDTSEPNISKPQAPLNKPNTKLNPQTRGTTAEYPPSANVERERHVGVAFESSQSMLRVEARPQVPQPQAAAEASVRQPRPELQEVTQIVFALPLLLNIAHELANELNEQALTVFGYHLNVGPHILQKLSRQYPQLIDRTRHLLTFWLQTWQGSQEAAITAIINALHEVQIHHLAEQFSRIYTTQQGTSELHDVSLSSRTMGSGSSEHGNISVHSREAQFVEPQAEPQTEQPQIQSAVEEAVVTIAAPQELPDIMPLYRMDRKPRGICIIINNEKFHKDPGDTGARDMPNREGTKVDGENLLNTFTELYFEVRLYDNLKSTDMVRLLVDVALNTDHSVYDCFVCCILSHGTQGHIYGTDGRLVSINDLTGPFKSIVCPTLAGKPKLFFIQACQGREKQPGQEIEKDGAPLQVDGLPREVIPNEADFLLGYATVPGFVSYRSRSHGSWYITKLCEMLNKHGTRYDLLSVLLLVNNEVGRANAMMDGGRFKQSPAPLYTLRKKLMFR